MKRDYLSIFKMLRGDSWGFRGSSEPSFTAPLSAITGREDFRSLLDLQSEPNLQFLLEKILMWSAYAKGITPRKQFAPIYSNFNYAALDQLHHTELICLVRHLLEEEALVDLGFGDTSIIMAGVLSNLLHLNARSLALQEERTMLASEDWSTSDVSQLTKLVCKLSKREGSLRFLPLLLKLATANIIKTRVAASNLMGVLNNAMMSHLDINLDDLQFDPLVGRTSTKVIYCSSKLNVLTYIVMANALIPVGVLTDCCDSESPVRLVLEAKENYQNTVKWPRKVGKLNFERAGHKYIQLQKSQFFGLEHPAIGVKVFASALEKKLIELFVGVFLTLLNTNFPAIDKVGAKLVKQNEFEKSTLPSDAFIMRLLSDSLGTIVPTDPSTNLVSETLTPVLVLNLKHDDRKFQVIESKLVKDLEQYNFDELNVTGQNLFKNWSILSGLNKKITNMDAKSSDDDAFNRQEMMKILNKVPERELVFSPGIMIHDQKGRDYD